MPHTDFRRDHAAWLRHIYTKADWLASEFRTHVFFSWLPGVTILTVLPDLMHAKHLGTDAYFNGSVLVLLVYAILPGCSFSIVAEYICVPIECECVIRVKCSGVSPQYLSYVNERRRHFKQVPLRFRDYPAIQSYVHTLVGVCDNKRHGLRTIDINSDCGICP